MSSFAVSLRTTRANDSFAMLLVKTTHRHGAGMSVLRGHAAQAQPEISIHEFSHVDPVPSATRYRVQPLSHQCRELRRDLHAGVRHYLA